MAEAIVEWLVRARIQVHRPNQLKSGFCRLFQQFLARMKWGHAAGKFQIVQQFPFFGKKVETNYVEKGGGEVGGGQKQTDALDSGHRSCPSSEGHRPAAALPI